ncbi:hypothetical protein [Sphingomonas crocodyli]|uniref:Uncharacterized protein n=1 Tax=Sphingomonas crocodyli TaxID=1979270 RepID=A0A437M721_9SPHN|nr:hypothetical protein [Sphingomonas crocodyli]RVT93462.1 hypothetical protein EOD43_06185 [Sphingomonas crocodyli]
MITTHNLAWFETLDVAALSSWLAQCLRRHRETPDDRMVFAPLHGDFDFADTPAAALANAIAQLPQTTQVTFGDAVAMLIGQWPANDSVSWLILIELAWRLDLAQAVDILASRASASFLDTLFENDAHRFEIIIGFCRNLMGQQRPGAIAFLYKLVEHPLFDDSDARGTLLALCERAPREITAHLCVLREQLHAQAQRIARGRGEDAKEQFHLKLASDIFDAVGIDQICTSVPKWFVVASDDSDCPSDYWLLKHILRICSVRQAPPDGILLAPPGQSANVRRVSNFAFTVETAPMDADLTDPDIALGVTAAALDQVS